MKRIKIIMHKDDDYPFETTVDATDRIVIYTDSNGTSVRSDGERFDIINKTEENNQVNFDTPLDVFKSKPWNL